MEIESERMSGASNGIGNTRGRSSKQRWRRNIRPSVENLGRCRNKTNNNIITRRRKKFRTSRWNLGRDKNKSIQISIPKRK
jgi:hypothetical protein